MRPRRIGRHEGTGLVVLAVLLALVGAGCAGVRADSSSASW